MVQAVLSPAPRERPPGARPRPGVLHLIAPAAFGGAERVLGDLTAGLAAAGGLRVGVVAVLGPGEDPPWLRELADIVPVERVETSGRRPGRELRAVAAVLARWRPDIVHTHGYRCDILYPHLGRRRGARTVSTVHGFTGGGLRMWLYERLQTWSLRRLDAVVAVSGPLGKDLGRRGVSHRRLHVIRNALRTDDALLGRDAARHALGLPTDRFLVAWVGRFSREKGPDLLPPVASALTSPDILLVAVGDGPGRGEVEAATRRLGLEARLRLLGAVPHAARYLKAFDALLVSSRTEGTPMVVLEAMHAGVPVVATRVGGVPEMLVPGAGILVRPDSPRALATALERLARDPELARRLVWAARRRISTRYAFDGWVARYRSLYDTLLGPA